MVPEASTRRYADQNTVCTTAGGRTVEGPSTARGRLLFAQKDRAIAYTGTIEIFRAPATKASHEFSLPQQCATSFPAVEM